MRIPKDNSAVLIIDFQERLFPHIYENHILQGNILRLIAGLKIMEIPMILTEQYSKGLGPTIKPVKDLVPGILPIEKITFSCCGNPEVMKSLSNLDRKYIIIGGIEAHVCVLQTVIDLLSNNFIPVVIADCISSRKENDKLIALERIKKEGAIISTYESILLELCYLAGNEVFRSLSNIIK